MARNFTDEYIRHQFYLVGLSYGQANSFLKVLDETHAPATAVLLAGLPQVLNARSLSKLQRKRIDVLSRRIAKLRTRAVKDYRKNFERALAELVGRETAYNTRQFNSLPGEDEAEDPKTSLIAPVIIGAGIYDGRTTGEWFAQFAAGDAGRIKQQISAGVVSGMSESDIVKSVFGSKNMGYKNGIVNTTRNAARTLVRTVWNGVANEARKAFSRVNEDAIAYELYTAVLDGRTTLLCASLDGNKYEVGSGPYPPLHRNCRSMRYPVPVVLQNANILSDRMAVRDTRTPKELRKDFRADAKRRVGGSRWSQMNEAARRVEIGREKQSWVRRNVGTAPATETWATWFKRQPADFKRDYLGPTRYKAYKAGKSLGSFVAPSGRPWTIAQLEQRGMI